MSSNKQTEFFDKVDVSVSIAKLIFSYLEESFPCKTISDIATTTSGGTPLRGHSDYYGGNIPWIKSGELNDGIITEYEETITEQGLKNSSAKVYPKGTLVLALYGATAGKTGIIDFATSSNQAVAAVYPNIEVERDYLFWFFRQKRFDFIQMSFGAAQPNISQAVVKATRIAVPTKEVQKEVIDFLNVIERNRELIWKSSLEQIWTTIKGFYNLYQTRQTLLKELDQQQTYLLLLRQTILQEAVQGKLSEPGFIGLNDFAEEKKRYGKLWNAPAIELLAYIKAEKEKSSKSNKSKSSAVQTITSDEISYELPEGWVWCRLGELITLMDAGWSPACIETPASIEKWGVLKTTAVQQMEYLEYENKELPNKLLPKEQYEVKSGDILFTRAGPFNRVGICCLVENTRSKLMISDKIIRFHLFDKNVSPTYITLCLNTGVSKAYIESKKSGMALSQVNISQDNLKLTPIPLPPLAEQQRIVTKVQQLQQQLKGLETQVAESRKYAQQLLQSVLKEVFEQKDVYAIEDELSMVREE